MFQRLAHEWGPNRPRAKDDATPVYTPKQVADKVKVWKESLQVAGFGL